MLVSLALSLTGLLLWKRWESATPSHEQYSLAAGGTWREGVFDTLLLGGEEGKATYSRNASLVDDEHHGYRLGGEHYEDEGEEDNHASLLRYTTPKR